MSEPDDDSGKDVKQRSRGADASGFCFIRVALAKYEGAGSAGRTTAPAILVGRKGKRPQVVRQGRNRTALPAQWFYGCSAISPEYRAC